MEIIENNKKFGFIKVKCHECSNEQVISGKCSSEIKCLKCKAVVAIPRGGKAAVKAEILEMY